MEYFELSPEVAGGLGPRTSLNRATHPPVISFLHYEVNEWLGDDLVESFPCFLVSPEAGSAMTLAHLSGFRLENALVTWSEEIDPFYDKRANAQVLEFKWLIAEGLPGMDDIAVDATATLVVSRRALDILRTFSLTNCDIDTRV